MSQESSAPLDYSILLVIIIGSFMAMLDGTIVNVTLPRLMAVFGASPDRIQWVVTIYMLTLGIVMPVSGYLGDTFGYKRLYMASLAVFVAGSALCGLAWNLDALIGARVLQAVGGGIMQPVGMAMLYHNYPRSRMGMVLGLWGISAMLAPAVGPTLGGYLVDSVSWRVIFYLNLPIGVVNLFLASVILDETERLVGKHFDLVGLVSASVGLFCLLLALSQGNQHGWSSPYIVSLLAVSGVSLAVLAVNEWFHPEPILDLSLLKNSLFTISLVIGSILAIGMFGVI
ncbi:MAG: DHA2 family efflux MFS transporter permease subunit, partial [Syntrophomonadaceae bacterium]|nr:DHA2 family efflux MFS transporter permease subunit [Syntrophomonadaceae bacterium]